MKNKIKLTLAACIGYFILMGGVMSVLAAGTLSIAVSSNSASLGSSVTITVYADDANGQAVTDAMTITYDSSKLEYVSTTGQNASVGGGVIKATGSEIGVTFKTIANGDAYVKAESATLTAAGAHIMVSDGSTTTNLSGDNSLSALTISPGVLSPAFKPGTTQYTAEVGNEVDEIAVTPVKSSSKASIVSVTGNTGLQEGENTIVVRVKAENGTEASYTIIVTKKDTPGTEVSETTTSGEFNQSGDIIEVDGVKYTISEDFTEEQTPEGFTRTDFEYKGAPYQGVIFDHGHLGMYYMVSEFGEGKFFIYDADRDKFYPYVRLTSGEHYIVLMVVPNGAIPPADYEETTLVIGNDVTIPAYQYAGAEDEEIVNFDTEDINGGKSDFYIVYGMDTTGVSGWYQYDIKQGTYQRFNEEYRVENNGGEQYESLLASYNELSERYKKTKTGDRRLIAALIFISVVLMIVIINLIIKIRENADEEDDEEDDDEGEEKIPVKREKAIKEKPIKEKPVKEKIVKKKVEKKRFIKESEDEWDDDWLDEEEETFFKKRVVENKPEKIEEDIEFIDFNDL